MADQKISQLTGATTPLAGTEVLPIVQSGVTKQVSVANLTAGRAISATSVTASTGNFVVSTSGQGIDFSATPGTGTSELLNDYEEGTVTVTAVCGTSGTITLAADRMAYTRVGRLVTLSGYLDVSAVSSPTGSLSIAGLPFTCASGGTGYPFNAGVTVFGTGLTVSAITSLQGYVGGGTTSIVIQKFSAGASTDAAAVVQANAAFMLSVAYFTS